MQQLENEPYGLSLRIMNLRAYARAKHELETAKGSDRTRLLKEDPMAKMVLHIQGEIGRKRQVKAEGDTDE